MMRSCFCSVLIVLFVFAGAGKANPDLYVSDERPNWIPLLLFVIISSGIAASIGISMMCRRIRLPEVPEIHPMPDEEEVDIDETHDRFRRRRQPASFYKSYPFDYDDSEFDDDEDDDDVRGRATSRGPPVTSHQAPLPVINVNTHRL